VFRGLYGGVAGVGWVWGWVKSFLKAIRDSKKAIRDDV
jgi:hypothetical protein